MSEALSATGGGEGEKVRHGAAPAGGGRGGSSKVHEMRRGAAAGVQSEGSK